MALAGDITYASDLGGVVARGRRTSATGNVTTTETGVLRLDGIPVRAGRAYRISTSNINLDTSVANDIAAANLRISTSGAATTSSTQICQMRNTIDDAANSNVLPMTAFYYPSGAGTLSVLLSIVRVSGTGNIILFASTVEILDLVVTDEGTDPGNTGVVL
jgi:hypothetical protein